MKTKLILTTMVSLALSSCVTQTETRPDGTVVKTESVDKDAVSSGVALAKIIIDSKSGK